MAQLDFFVFFVVKRCMLFGCSKRSLREAFITFWAVVSDIFKFLPLSGEMI